MNEPTSEERTTLSNPLSAPSQLKNPMSTPTSLPISGDLLFFTGSEVAELLRVSKLTVYRFVDRGLLPVYRIGRALRFRKDDVAAFTEACRGSDWHGDQPCGRT